MVRPALVRRGNNPDWTVSAEAEAALFPFARDVVDVPAGDEKTVRRSDEIIRKRSEIGSPASVVPDAG